MQDEAGFESQQMRMMRMMAADGDKPAASAPKPPPPPPPPPEDLPTLIEEHAVQFSGTACNVRVSLPLSYPKNASEKYNALFMLDTDVKLFETAAATANAAFAAVRHIDGRNWYPELIVVALSPAAGSAPLAPGKLLGLVSSELKRFIDGKYRTFGYAGGCALCGHASDGAPAAFEALRNYQLGVLQRFQHVMVGAPGHMGSVDGHGALDPKGAFLLSVGLGAGEQAVAAARATKAALTSLAGNAAQATATVMQVDRYGEQQYRQEAALGVLIELRELEGTPTAEALTRDAVQWLGLRMEKRKLERLGSLLPWHEFK